MSNKPVYINPEGASQAQGQYTHVARVESGPMYFIAGQLAVAEDGSVAGVNDFEAQFHQVFKNLKAVINGLGISHSDIVRFNTILVHEQHIDLFKKLRSEYFPTIFDGDFPPNTLVVVKRLVKEEFLLEVEAIAVANN